MKYLLDEQSVETPAGMVPVAMSLHPNTVDFLWVLF